MTGEILVTGASSFIGRAVVERLAATGQPIVAVTHKAALPQGIAALCSRVVRGNLSSPRVLGEALDGVAGVCHLAAYRPADYADPAEAANCIEVNALGTLELARAALSRGISRIVYASASNAYCAAGRPGHRRAPDSAERPRCLVSHQQGNRRVLPGQASPVGGAVAGRAAHRELLRPRHEEPERGRPLCCLRAFWSAHRGPQRRPLNCGFRPRPGRGPMLRECAVSRDGRSV